MLVAGLIIIPITLIVDLGMYTGKLDFDKGDLFGINVTNITQYYTNLPLGTVIHV